MKFIVIALTLLAAACKPLSYPLAGGDPSDPSVPVAAGTCPVESRQL